ncbi:MAG: PAS domain S-box protein [SAR324 cluster bacterium]|nr:PAS domain S-box protein [SAR324 cluster bacterium]
MKKLTLQFKFLLATSLCFFVIALIGGWYVKMTLDSYIQQKTLAEGISMHGMPLEPWTLYQISIGLFIGAGIVTMLFINLLFYQMITSRIKISAEAMDKYAKFPDEMVYLYDDSEDELGVMAAAFNHMVQELYESRHNLIQNEKLIKESNDFLSHVLNSITYPLHVIDVETYKIVLSNSASNLGDLKKSNTCYALTHHKTEPCSGKDICPLTEVVRSKKKVTVEHTHYNKDGVAHHYEVTAYPIFDKRGEVSLIIESSFDITERKRAEKATQESEENYRLLVETAPEAIISIDSNSNILFVNNAVKKIFGYTEEELLHQPLTMLMPKHLQKAHLIASKRYIETQRKHLPWKGAEIIGVHKNKEEIFLQMSIGERIKDGEHIFTGFLRDITAEKKTFWEKQEAQALAIHLEKTAQKELEERVKERTRELEESLDTLHKTQTQLAHSEKMASVGTLVAGVAHEINNPASFAQSGAQNLERRLQELQEFIYHLAEDEQDIQRIFEPKFDPLFKNLRAIIDGTVRIGDIVKNLRQFSRLGEKEAKEVSVVEGLESSVALVRPNYKENVQFVCDFEAAPSIRCWYTELNQVFVNIIINSCQAIVEQQRQSGSKWGTLTIRTSIAEDQLVILFEDTGIGIPAEVKNKIFDPFFTTKSTGEGTGLGLSISYDIVQKHKGQITVDSKEGCGTTITVLLPLAGVS